MRKEVLNEKKNNISDNVMFWSQQDIIMLHVKEK